MAGSSRIARAFARLRGGPMLPVTRAIDEAASDIGRRHFTGQWRDRHPLTVPGRYYAGMTDTFCDGPPIAPASLLFDEHGSGFVGRQPRDLDEVSALELAAEREVMAGYGDDGDVHWTSESVERWWDQRHARLPAVDRVVEALTGPLPERFLTIQLDMTGPADEAASYALVADWLAYLDGDLRADLERYAERLRR